MYNLLEYCDNCFVEFLKNVYGIFLEKKNDDVDDEDSDGIRWNIKQKEMGKTEVRPQQPPFPPTGGDWPPQPLVLPLSTEITIRLKYPSNFWRLPLINC